MIYNRTLGDHDRIALKPAIDLLWKHAPEIMPSKIERANVQQGFVLDASLALIPKKAQILCVGSYMDPVPVTLTALGYSVISIDPVINFSLGEYRAQEPGCFGGIISTSVIEHVPDDEQFIRDICALLAPGAFAVLTCDFLEGFKSGDRVPPTGLRLYTAHDIQVRLRTVMQQNHADLYGDCQYTGTADFEYGECRYGFASLLMQKER